MHIDKYIQGNGTYLYNEIEYDTSVDLIQCGILEFCGCGSPENNLDYIRRGLELINKRHKAPYDSPIWIWKHYKDLRQQVHGSESAALFFDYWTAQLNLTEHGGSIIGCWLSSAGFELLEDLTEMYKDGVIPYQ